MKFNEFKNGLENGEKTFSLYLFEGEDAFFRERAVSLLEKKFVTEPSLNVATFNGESFSENDLISSISAYPFMSEKRLTIIKEFYPKTQLVSLLEKTISGNDTGIVAVLNEKPSESLKKIDGVCVVDCAKADNATIARYIKSQCQTAGVEIDLQTSAFISECCRQDMKHVLIETEKLISFVGDRKVIKISDVDEIVPKDDEYKIYQMTDYVGKKQFDKAMSVIKDMLSKGETAQRIIVSIYNYFRRLLHVAISSSSDMELAKQLGIKEFAVKKTKEQASMFKVKSLKKAVDVLCDADFNLKNGNLDAESGMWNTIFTIMING